MTYKASMDPLAKGITFVIILLFVALGQKSYIALMAIENGSPELFLHLGILLLFVAILVGSWLYSTKSYSLQQKELLINRPIGHVKFNYADIQEVRKLEHYETRGTLRTFAVGGLFGYFGKYYIPSIGSCTFYATQSKNKLLIITKNHQKIILTPDDLSFAEHLKQMTIK
jgi:hypothetical protein